MDGFDVCVWAIRRRAGRRRPFEVRWRAAGRARSRSFLTRALADGYRAELVRAARQGLEFDPRTGEPAAWARPDPVSWYEHAAGYAAVKWPSLAAHSRASLADALATITPALTRQDARGRPSPGPLRTALYQHAFDPASPAADPTATRILDWARQASLPVARLAEPAVLRAVLEALTWRLDGRRAAATTIARKRAVLHAVLGYAVEAGLVEANPLDRISWHPPASSPAIDPAVVASPAQAAALLAAAGRLRPGLAGFFGCLYYAALRPEEAIALRQHDCHLPATGWGLLTLTATAPRTATAWTSTGTPHEQRGLKHRPDGTIRQVPIPPVLVSMLRRHLRDHGTAPDGRLFRGTRGGPLSESVCGRTWHAARTIALEPELAATGLARRPYDLRHAALWLWLNAGGDPAQIAARAGHSVTVLLAVYTHCIHGRDDILNQQIDTALQPAPAGRCHHPGTAAHGPGPCRSPARSRHARSRHAHGRAASPIPPMRRACRTGPGKQASRPEGQVPAAGLP
ncbi:MAG: tyrosine-type recombinase/integrase [Streptosporangiaceae bacterium]